MKVRDVMQKNPLTVRPDDNLGLVAQIMAWEEIRHLPVVEGDRVVAFLSERDILARKPEVGAAGLVSEIMSEPVQSVFPNDDLTAVADRMVSAKTDGFPVIDRGRLVGVVTTTDILGRTVRGPFKPPTELLARQIMTPNPETAAMDDRLLDAVGRMAQRGIRHLPIVDGDRHVLGMISDRDVRTTIGTLLSSDEELTTRQLSMRTDILRVSDVVRQAPITLPDTASIDSLIRLLVERRVGAVPVLDEDERLVGIVSYLDILSRGLAGEDRAARLASKPAPPEQPHA